MREFLACCRTIGTVTVEIEGQLDISASVGAGGVNRPDDVRAIQQALNRVPLNQGGPSPPLAVDGKVGPQTIDAISRFQMRQLGWSDGRVDTDNQTIAKLRAYSSRAAMPTTQAAAAPVGAGSPKNMKVTAPPAKKPDELDIGMMQAIYRSFRGARHWIFMADMAAANAQDYLRRPQLTNVGQKSYGLCSKYFKLQGLKRGDAIAALDFVRRILLRMKTCVGFTYDIDPSTSWNEGWFQFDPTNGNGNPKSNYMLYTAEGGFFRGPKFKMKDSYRDDGTGEMRQDGMYVNTKAYLQRLTLIGPLTFQQQLILDMVHEMAHFVGPPPNHPNKIYDYGTPSENQKKFDNLSHYLAMRNAESYARFAAEATPGVSINRLQ